MITLLVFEDPEATDRMRNKREIEILKNVFSALNHVKGLMSVEQSIKSKTSQAITSENKAVIMLDDPGNGSNEFVMQITEPLFQLIPLAINTPQFNCCLSNMANVLHLMGDTEHEDFFRMNMDKNLLWFHQKLHENSNRQFCINTSLGLSFWL